MTEVNEAPKRNPHVDTWVTAKRMNDIQMPIDYTFKNLTKVDTFEMTDVRRSRFGNIPTGKNSKYLSRTLWLNHNRISDTSMLNSLATNVLEYPDRLAFLDLSRNELTKIDDNLLTLKALKILYLHDNKIRQLYDIYKLRKLKHLRTLTLYANPIYENTKFGNPRTVVHYLLPNIEKLDFNKMSGIETKMPVGPLVVRFLAKMDGMVLPYIPCRLKDTSFFPEEMREEVNRKETRKFSGGKRGVHLDAGKKDSGVYLQDTSKEQQVFTDIRRKEKGLKKSPRGIQYEDHLCMCNPCGLKS